MQYLAQATQTVPDFSNYTAALYAMSGTIAIVALVSVVLTILIWFMIFKRTGMNPWLSLLMLVPIANLVMLLILAFSEWPVQRERRLLRAQVAGTGSYPPPAAPYAPPAPPNYSTLPPPPTPPTPLG